jgi:hypothetical protein
MITGIEYDLNNISNNEIDNEQLHLAINKIESIKI